jgi:hypothetical protein
MFKKNIIYSLIVLFYMTLLTSTKCYAVDIQILQEQCADIGFKIKTPANGKCVLQLMQTVKNKEAQALADQRAYEAKVATENAQRQQEATLRRQQSEMLELQRRSIEAQENVASEQRRSAGLQLMQKGLESLSGANRPAPVPILRTPIECRTYGNRTTCD